MQENNGIYEWDAEAYHRFSDMQYDIAHELLDSLELRGDETIIDAGCGSGRVTKDILPRLPKGKLLGVDLSNNMLDMARDVVRPQPGQFVEFIQSDLQTFVIPNVADGIFSSMAMHFVPDHATMFRNLARTLKPGGWLAVQFAGTGPKDGWTQQFRQLIDEPPFGPYLKGSMPHMHDANVDDSRRELDDAGFIDIDVQEIKAELIDAHRESMHQFFKSSFLGTPLQKLPNDDMRKEFLTACGVLLDDMFSHPFSYIRCRAKMPVTV